jgi:hypothetical protein
MNLIVGLMMKKSAMVSYYNDAEIGILLDLLVERLVVNKLMMRMVMLMVI